MRAPYLLAVLLLLSACAPRSTPPAKGPVTSPFGSRETAGSSERHMGADIGIPVGTPVRSFRRGVVSFAGRQRGYGLIVIVDHGKGLESRYAHLNALNVRRGEKVKRGQVIGRSGNSGRSTAPHLHFEVRKNGKPINPRRFVSPRD